MYGKCLRGRHRRSGDDRNPRGMDLADQPDAGLDVVRREDDQVRLFLDRLVHLPALDEVAILARQGIAGQFDPEMPGDQLHA